MNTKSKFDFKSIRFKLWIYFILFAAVIVGLIWFLQVFFLDAYYEDMKLKETDRIAKFLVQEFWSDSDIFVFAEKINEVSAGTDVYIRVETGDGKILIAPEFNGFSQPYLYLDQTVSLRERLSTSTDFDAFSEITPGPNNTRVLAYATFLQRAIEYPSAELNATNSVILYLFSPLYPVQSTVSILRTQLIYVTIIAMIMALGMAIYMATRISKPIKDITENAAEMGKGNYGVQFTGGHYSEITELADTLTAASRELEKSDMYQKDLIANVSHDLKTPLTMIRSYAEMVKDLSGEDPEKREKHISVIIEEADRLNILVDDMLTMSRMQQRTVPLERSDFDICESCRTLLASYEILSEQEGYAFKYTAPDSVVVSADEPKIRQVLANLINNAVKYCGEDKEVIIEISRPTKGRVRCEISDHGQGIAPDEINHVWERYYKSSTHHVRPTEGSGLGLSIVKEILSMHKAEYGVRSKLGEGSTFWFELDVAKRSGGKR